MIEQVAVTCEGLEAKGIALLEGTEGMNELSRWTVVAVVEDAGLDVVSLVTKPACLVLGDEDGNERSVFLLVMCAAYAGDHPDGHLVEIALSDPHALLGHAAGSRTFIEMSAVGIVQMLVAEAGLRAPELRLSKSYPKRPYTAQYREPTWRFIERLLAEEGINFWFEGTDESLLVLGDLPSAHAELTPAVMPFQDASGMARVASAFYELEHVYEMAPTRTHLIEYDVTQPDVLIEGQAGEGAHEVVAYPSRALDAEHAQQMAEHRLEQLRRHQARAHAKTHAICLRPGFVVGIAGAVADASNGHHLVSRLSHRVRQATARDGAAESYSCSAVLIPQDGDACHRGAPPRWPNVGGVESAFVTGPAGEEIHVDPLGRIKVRFPWDRSGVLDDGSSFWVRTMQLNMDRSMLLPRMNWEVPVAYRCGNVDSPHCLGRLYNPVGPPPYDLPKQKATAALKSETSPSDGTSNVIRFDDDKAKQQMLVNSSGDQNVAIGGDSTTEVAVNETHNVVGNFKEKVDSQSVAVGGLQDIAVGGAMSTKVGGSRTVIVGGSENIGVTKNRTVDAAGSYTEAVGGVYFLRCNQGASGLQGSFTQAIGGALVVGAGCGIAELTAGARTEINCGPRNITCAVFADSTSGPKVVTSGAANFTGGVKCHTDAGAALIVNAGSTSVTAGSKTLIKGSSVTITAASISIKAGSTFKCAGSHTGSADANVKTPSAKVSGGTKAGS